jgi:hypothetical protein
MIEYTKIAHLKYPRHAAYAYQIKGSDLVHCIRYNNQALEWDYFEQDWSACKEKMTEEPTSWRWGFCEDNPEKD